MISLFDMFVFELDQVIDVRKKPKKYRKIRITKKKIKTLASCCVDALNVYESNNVRKHFVK